MRRKFEKENGVIEMKMRKKRVPKKAPIKETCQGDEINYRKAPCNVACKGGNRHADMMQ